MSCKKIKLGFTLRRHAEELVLSICSAFKKQGVDPEQKLFRMTLCNIGGFTLIEVLVVVLIIAVLTAVAVPMYKRAVLKSRFTTVMPMAKAVADAQEVYYLGNGQYALNTEELDVTLVDTEKTKLEVSDKDGYDYVLAQRMDIPGAHYIMYQQHSPHFAGEIHCEADKNNEEATWLCEKGLKGKKIGGSLTADYYTYLLEGKGMDISYQVTQAQNNFQCTGTEGGTCRLIDNKTKEICYEESQTFEAGWTGYVNGSFSGCKYVILNDDGTHSEKVDCEEVDGVQQCSTTLTYDENDQLIKFTACQSYFDNGTCEWYNAVDFDSITGKETLTLDYRCHMGWDYDDLYCERDVTQYTYDPITGEIASDTSYTCDEFNEQGDCMSYTYYEFGAYNYDPETSWQTSSFYYRCSEYDNENNVCNTYRSGGSSTSSFDPTTHTQTNYIGRSCHTFDENGHCTSYDRITERFYNPQNDITRAGNMLNFQTQEIQKNCNTWDDKNATLCTAWTTTVKNYDGAMKPTQIGDTQTCIYIAGATNNTADANGNCLE